MQSFLITTPPHLSQLSCLGRCTGMLEKKIRYLEFLNKHKMHIQDEGNHRQGVMEQDNVLRPLFDCAVSAAVPQASSCSSSDSATFVPVQLEFFLSAFTSLIVLCEEEVSLSFSSVKWYFFLTLLGQLLSCGAVPCTSTYRVEKINFFLKCG